MQVHEIKVPLQLSEHLENLRLVESMHFHRELRNRREQFVGRCEKRWPFPAFDIHLNNYTPADITIPSDLIFQRVEGMRFPLFNTIANAFVVKDKPATVARWFRRIETIVFITGT